MTEQLSVSSPTVYPSVSQQDVSLSRHRPACNTNVDQRGCPCQLASGRCLNDEGTPDEKRTALSTISSSKKSQSLNGQKQGHVRSQIFSGRLLVATGGARVPGSSTEQRIAVRRPLAGCMVLGCCCGSSLIRDQALMLPTRPWPGGKRQLDAEGEEGGKKRELALSLSGGTRSNFKTSANRMNNSACFGKPTSVVRSRGRRHETRGMEAKSWRARLLHRDDGLMLGGGEQLCRCERAKRDPAAIFLHFWARRWGKFGRKLTMLARDWWRRVFIDA